MHTAFFMEYVFRYTFCCVKKNKTPKYIIALLSTFEAALPYGCAIHRGAAHCS